LKIEINPGLLTKKVFDVIQSCEEFLMFDFKNLKLSRKSDGFWFSTQTEELIDVGQKGGPGFKTHLGYVMENPEKFPNISKELLSEVDSCLQGIGNNEVCTQKMNQVMSLVLDSGWIQIRAYPYQTSFIFSNKVRFTENSDEFYYIYKFLFMLPEGKFYQNRTIVGYKFGNSDPLFKVEQPNFKPKTTLEDFAKDLKVAMILKRRSKLV